MSVQWLSLQGMGKVAIDLSGIYNLVFFKRVNEFLRDEIAEFQARLLTDMMAFFGIVAANLMIIWILIQGFRIISGRSRDSMMALVAQGLRATLFVMLATSMASGGSQPYWTLTDGMGEGLEQTAHWT